MVLQINSTKVTTERIGFVGRDGHILRLFGNMSPEVAEEIAAALTLSDGGGVMVGEPTSEGVEIRILSGVEEEIIAVLRDHKIDVVID